MTTLALSLDTAHGFLQDDLPSGSLPSQTGAETRVLLCADDGAAREAFAAELRNQGLSVTTARPRNQPMPLTADFDHDVTILDTDLRGGDYVRVLTALIATLPGHPVILLARNADVGERVDGLNAGATDFMLKPLSVRELAARVRARMRFDRREKVRLRHGALEVDLEDRSVRHRDTPVHLSNLEFHLLVYFLRHSGQIRSRAEILRGVWGAERSLNSNVIDVYVGYLRRKLARQGFALPLTTIKKFGYRLESPEASFSSESTEHDQSRPRGNNPSTWRSSTGSSSALRP